MSKHKKIKWLIYTVLVGLIPILLRLLIHWVTKEGLVKSVSTSDFISFGLVLHISNINEIEHLMTSDQSWKTIQNGLSITFIAFYSMLFGLTLVSENTTMLIEEQTLQYCTMTLALISLLISCSVYDRISYNKIWN
ncbi:hypothetical protein [Rippkaea orientalis]|nr:hypothetical protein [Rippkaea orientalis]